MNPQKCTLWCTTGVNERSQQNLKLDREEYIPYLIGTNPTMIRDYALDPTLYERCIRLIDSCFPGIEEMASKGKSHHAHWDRSSTPFIITHEQEIVSHIGILPFDVVIDGNTYHAGALHGICTKESHRRKGYFRTLMQEALLFIEHHYDFGFLFTDIPTLYEPFGFATLSESDFVSPFSKGPTSNKLRKLYLDASQDCALFQEMLVNRLPISNKFGIIKETTVATLNAQLEPIYYIEDQNVFIAYQVRNDFLLLKDVIFTKPCQLIEILSAIPESFTKVVIQFSPDVFSQGPFEVVPATPECALMVTHELKLSEMPFQYPALYRC